MAKKAPIHVRLHGGNWAVIREGNATPSSAHRTQAQALRRAAALAKRDRTRLILHSKSGHVRRETTYEPKPRERAPEIPTRKIKKAAKAGIAPRAVAAKAAKQAASAKATAAKAAKQAATAKATAAKAAKQATAAKATAAKASAVKVTTEKGGAKKVAAKKVSRSR